MTKRPEIPERSDEGCHHLVAYYFYLERLAGGIEGDAVGDWSAAEEYLSSAEAMAPRVDPSLGIVYPERPQESDDLTLIAGMDAVTVEMLNGRGIYRLAQIASWTPAVVAALGLGVRVGSDDWIGQARRLVAGSEAAS